MGSDSSKDLNKGFSNLLVIIEQIKWKISDVDFGNVQLKE